MAGPKVLVVDDEPNVCRLVQVYLEREGITVCSAHKGTEALRIFREEQPDLVLLDLMLPGIDGWEVCRNIRRESDTPVMMLTARGEEMDRVLGFELGADDYVTKPFSPRELVLRVKAVLRRAGSEDTSILHFPGLVIDGERRQVWKDGEEITLTRKEFDLLWHLAYNAGRAYDRDQLLERVWGYDYTGDKRTIDVHITRLREKVHADETGYSYIHTVWGIGYKFDTRKDEDE